MIVKMIQDLGKEWRQEKEKKRMEPNTEKMQEIFTKDQKK